MAPQPTRRLAIFIGHFCREQILWNYLEDSKLMVRVNQVMRRVGLAALPAEFATLLPTPENGCPSEKARCWRGFPA